MTNPSDIVQAAPQGLKPRALHRTLFKLADCYNQVATLSLDRLVATKDADFAAPAILCRSFAIELLLKFFVVVRFPEAKHYSDLCRLGVDLQGHSYSGLFDRIDEESRELIATTYSQHSGQVTTAAEFRGLLIAIGDKPFLEWRYVYESRENRHLNPVLLAALVDSLGLAAQSEVRRLNEATE